MEFFECERADVDMSWSRLEMKKDTMAEERRPLTLTQFRLQLPPPQNDVVRQTVSSTRLTKQVALCNRLGRTMAESGDWEVALQGSPRSSPKAS